MTDYIDDQNNRAISVSLSDAELIGLLGQQASRYAIERAEARVSFILALLLAVIGLIAGAGTFYFNRVIETAVAEQIEDRVTSAVNDAMVLPLVVSNVSGLIDRGGYSQQDGSAFVRILAANVPMIEGLAGDNRWLANRRLEDLMDVFLHTGDYANVMAVHRLFNGSLLQERGILITTSQAMTLGIMMHPDFDQEHSDVLEDIRGLALDHRSVEYEYHRMPIVLAEASSNGWDSVGIGQAVAAEFERDPYFLSVLNSLMSMAEEHFGPEGRNQTSISMARFAEFRTGFRDF